MDHAGVMLDTRDHIVMFVKIPMHLDENANLVTVQRMQFAILASMQMAHGRIGVGY